MVVVPEAVRAFRPRTVLDVGCGAGHWAAVFEALGIPVVGVDGPQIDPRLRLVSTFVPWDLGQPLPELGRFDLGVCLEVAEHLPPEAAGGLVDGLCRSADRWLFSAAVPGQGGDGHLNEQPHEYWIGQFAGHDFQADASWRDRFAADERVEWWYRQNVLVMTRG
jgi:SAM-dependent methyltransferase